MSSLEPLESARRELSNAPKLDIWSANGADNGLKNSLGNARILRIFSCSRENFARKVRGAPHEVGVRFFFIIKTKECRRFEIEKSAYTVLVLVGCVLANTQFCAGMLPKLSILFRSLTSEDGIPGGFQNLRI